MAAGRIPRRFCAAISRPTLDSLGRLWRAARGFAPEIPIGGSQTEGTGPENPVTATRTAKCKSVLVCGVGWLHCLSGVRQPLRRPVPRSSSATANTVAAHPREPSEEPVQRALRSSVGGGMEASDAGPSIHPKPERRLIPQAPASMDRGVSSALEWINLTTLFLRRFACRSCYRPRSGDSKGSTLRA